MPILGKDGKYRPLGHSGDPMDKKQYDEYMKDRTPKSQDRKYNTKGSDYKPGRRAQRPRAVPAIEESIKEDIESA